MPPRQSEQLVPHVHEAAEGENHAGHATLLGIDHQFPGYRRATSPIQLDTSYAVLSGMIPRTRYAPIESHQTRRWVGIVTDRDLAVKLVAEGCDVKTTSDTWVPC
jgi:hypothetical protein